MRKTTASLALLVLTTAACGQFAQVNPDEIPASADGAAPVATPQDPTPDASTADASKAESDAAAVVDADAAVAPPTCPLGTELVSEPIVASASAFLGDSGQHFDFPVCNMSSGNCIMRFSPSADALAAFASDLVGGQNVLDVMLIVHRATTSSECGGSCMALREDGTLSINATRSDWDPTAVTFVKRDGNNSWQAAGPGGTDISSQAGNSALTAAADDTASATITPAAFASFLGGGTTTTISVRSTFLKAGARRQFVVVLGSAGSTQPVEPPKLTIRYCH